MNDMDAQPRTGAVRFTDDGRLEVFDGTQWTAYEPKADEPSLGSVYRLGPDEAENPGGTAGLAG